MAGGSEKKSAARRKRALTTWGGIAVAFMAAHIGKSVLFSDKGVLGALWDLTSLSTFVLLGYFAFAVYSISNTAAFSAESTEGSRSAFDQAATKGRETETSKDMFYIAAATIVLSWITSYAWYLLYIVPVYLSWTWGTWAWDKYSMFKAMAGGGAAPGGAVATGAAPDARNLTKKDEKKKRQADQQAHIQAKMGVKAK